MPIEFDCPHCNQLVATPESAAGKKGRCPSCKSVVQIPMASTKKMAPVRQVAPNEAFEFPCPSCGNAMRATGALIGKKGRCASCKSVVTIEAPRDTAAPVSNQAVSNQPASGKSARAVDNIDEDSLIADFGKEDERAVEAPSPKPGPASTPSAMPGQPGNPWAAWGQGGAAARPMENPLLSALDDAKKSSAPATQINPYQTAAMAKAAERGIDYNWDDDERRRDGLPYERPRVEDDAFSVTYWAVLFDCSNAFSRMYVDKAVGKSVSFLVYGATISGLIIGAFYTAILLTALAINLSSASVSNERLAVVAGVLLGFSCISFIGGWIGAVLSGLIYTTAIAGVVHIMILMTGGSRRGFGTTFKVVAYVMGACMPLLMVPCVNMIMGIAIVVLIVIGIHKAHTISGGRAVAVVVLPYLAFSIAITFLAISIYSQIPPPSAFPGR